MCLLDVPQIQDNYFRFFLNEPFKTENKAIEPLKFLKKGKKNLVAKVLKGTLCNFVWMIIMALFTFLQLFSTLSGRFVCITMETDQKPLKIRGPGVSYRPP